MGFEVELKYRVSDPADLARRLADRGLRPAGTIDHEDIYFAHPSRDFAATGEAIRIRGEGERNQITYKGPKLTGPAKTREEIEVEFGPGRDGRADVRRVFERLGFSVVAVVRKRRTTYHLDRAGRSLTVTVDHLEDLGHFAEVETLVAEEADLAAAQAAVVALATELGFDAVEPRSYLRMVLEAAGKLAKNPPGQT